jgi:glutamyl-tRNA synthetase
MPAIMNAFQELENWNAETIDSCLQALSESLAAGSLGKIAQPVRIAVAGGAVSPPINDTLVLLGKKSTLRRLERCHEYFASVCNA